jgi:hypothetical protein
MYGNILEMFPASKKMLLVTWVPGPTFLVDAFGPSAVRVNTETVYAGRSEADLVMTSTGEVKFYFTSVESRCGAVV